MTLPLPNPITHPLHPPHSIEDPKSLHVESRAVMYSECLDFRGSVAAESRFLVVGAGTLGSETLKHLALLGAGMVFLVDPDRVETRNLARSILYTAEDRGAFKVQAATRFLHRWAPDSHFLPIPGDIRFDVGGGLLRRVDAVLCCVDNRLARLHLSRRCASLAVPWVDAAIAEWAARVTAFSPDRGGCYECTLTPGQWEEISRERGNASCEAGAVAAFKAGRVPTTPLSASLASSLQVGEAFRLAHARRLPEEGSKYQVSFGTERYLTGPERTLVHSRYSPDPQCGSHGERWNVVEDEALTSADTLGTVWEKAVSHLGSHDLFWKPMNEPVALARCLACGFRERPWLPLESRGLRSGCPRCRKPLLFQPIHRVGKASPFLRRPLWDLGIPPLDILTFCDQGGKALRLELTGDLGRYPEALRTPPQELPVPPALSPQRRVVVSSRGSP